MFQLLCAATAARTGEREYEVRIVKIALVGSGRDPFALLFLTAGPFGPNGHCQRGTHISRLPLVLYLNIEHV